MDQTYWDSRRLNAKSIENNNSVNSSWHQVWIFQMVEFMIILFQLWVQSPNRTLQCGGGGDVNTKHCWSSNSGNVAAAYDNMIMWKDVTEHQPLFILLSKVCLQAIYISIFLYYAVLHHCYFIFLFFYENLSFANQTFWKVVKFIKYLNKDTTKVRSNNISRFFRLNLVVDLHHNIKHTKNVPLPFRHVWQELCLQSSQNLPTERRQFYSAKMLWYVCVMGLSICYAELETCGKQHFILNIENYLSSFTHACSYFKCILYTDKIMSIFCNREI